MARCRADRTWRRSAGTDLTDQWKDHEANDSGEQNQDWLGYFETYQNSQSEQSNQCGRPVEDGPLAQAKAALAMVSIATTTRSMCAPQISASIAITAPAVKIEFMQDHGIASDQLLALESIP